MKVPSLPGFDPEAFNKYFKNAGWLMVARVCSMFIKMLVTIFALPNYLGNAGFGVFNYALAITFLFVSLSTLGLDGFVTRELLRTPENKNKLLGSALGLRLISGSLSMVLCCAAYTTIVYCTSYSPPSPISYIVIASLICVVQAFNIIDSYLQAQAEGKQIMVVQVGANLLSALIKLILIILGAPLFVFILTLLLDALFLAVCYLAVFKHKGNKISDLRYDPSTARYLISRAWPLAISTVMVSLYIKIDQLMLEFYLGDAALGIYSTVVGLSEAWYFIPVAIVNALMPAIMNARRDDQARYRKRFQNLYDLMVLLGVAISLSITILAPYIYANVYKDEFAAGSTVLAVHIWACIFVFLGTASNQYLIAEGLTQLSLVRTAFGAIANILLNTWMIPAFGIIGAAYSTVISYALVTLSLVLVKQTRQQGFAIIKSLFFINLISVLSRYSRERHQRQK